MMLPDKFSMTEQDPQETDIPRLSAAITTPSLNFIAITDVPVTTGD